MRPKRSEGDPTCKQHRTSEERGLPMKWHTLNIYVKVTTLMGSLAALLLAASAGFKWI